MSSVKKRKQQNSSRANMKNKPRASDIDFIKVMIATDNRIGYLEKSRVRGGNSFRAIEEVLQLHRVNDVVMCLLGGDLFHQNKSSRSTSLRTMRILRKACLSLKGRSG